ncbi:hypothetical protein DUNSADRAFT_18664 [Dunaliella salina]|uniref:Uncharacterized protein n=1 Tax=Dunaliella salina TaxID=3046 RepID=A0ABQ7GYU9_DUNSA|nr:hypothetical protein DUNSADRAFT_18664 [Dunaliella salina]|eukprot:KAF5839786.1 hypothetical protein DUNSADRAFT_18664 [Dunaliella salina]
MTFTDSIFLGHLGTSQMAAAALGNTYSAFLQIFMFGMATALDTLGAQAFGAQKKGLPGTSLATWTTTSFIVMTILCILPMVGLSYAHTVASKLLSQTAQVSELMAVFCSGLIPGVPFVVSHRSGRFV